MLLDLSDAFDIIDHSVLFKWLSNQIGIKGMALKWFQSYLSDRYQYVKVEGQSVSLNHEVAQLPHLGHIQFNIYCTPIADILRELRTGFHVYADDHQLYLPFKPTDQDSANVVVNKIQIFMVEIQQCKVENMLKHNDDKTWFIVIETRRQRSIDIPHININGSDIASTSTVHNLGVMLDTCDGAKWNWNWHSTERLRV